MIVNWPLSSRLAYFTYMEVLYCYSFIHSTKDNTKRLKTYFRSGYKPVDKIQDNGLNT